MKILTPLYRRDARTFRQDAQEGDINARFNMGLTMERLGRIAEAEKWYWDAAYAGDGDALANLLDLLKRTGKISEEDAERHERAGIVMTLDAVAQLTGQSTPPR